MYRIDHAHFAFITLKCEVKLSSYTPRKQTHAHAVSQTTSAQSGAQVVVWFASSFRAMVARDAPRIVDGW
jgi:hypothetical protein